MTIKKKDNNMKDDHLKKQIDKERIIDEINYLKMRLEQIGYNGDCAYEKKLSSFYLNAISHCKEKLRPLL